MTLLKVSDICTNGGTQSRMRLDESTVGDYADAMTEGAAFPDVVVFYDGEMYWLADGFHRVAAAKQCGLAEIGADVRQGSRRDAVLYSVGANGTHGLRRSNEDKRQAVTTLLTDPEWSKWSNREIARRCAVSRRFVDGMRKDLTGHDAQLERTYVTKHGTVATMNTSQIGRQVVNPADGEPYTITEAHGDGTVNAVRTDGQITLGHWPESRLEAEEDDEALLSPAEDKWAAVRVSHPYYTTLGYEQAVCRYCGKTHPQWSPRPAGYWRCDHCGKDTPDIEMDALTMDDLRVKRRVARAVRQEQKRIRAASLADSIFNVIYADPPWQYNNNGVNAAAEKHYDTVPLDEICTLLQREHIHLAEDAVLFLWVTPPFAEDGFKVIREWGFTYKTQRVWVKTELKQPGVGWYVRGHHELLYIATRGSFTPLVDVSPPISSVITHPIMEHSRKPDCVHTDIERAYPGCNYLELFARRAREGWTAWGNEVEPDATP